MCLKFVIAMTRILCALILFLMPLIQSKDYTGLVIYNCCNNPTMCLPSKIDYFSYKLFKVHNTDNVLKFIESFNVYELNDVDIMLINRNVTHALVPPQLEMNFETLLQAMNATYSVDDDVQRYVSLIQLLI